MGYVSARVQCDVCDQVVETKDRHTPLGWYRVDVAGPGIRVGGARAYACSKQCARSLLSEPAADQLLPAAEAA